MSRFGITFFVFLFTVPVYSVENSLMTIEKDVIKLVDQLKPSVVTVSALFDYTLVDRKESTDGPIRRSVELTNIGSGIIYREGFIITRESVILGGKTIKVTFFDNTQTTAKMIGSDPEFGLAVLKTDQKQYNPVRIDDSQKVTMGCWALVVGNSLGISPAVSLGMINCVRDDGIIQISASVPAGNAGGPVFNAQGKLLGILAARINPTDENLVTGSSIMSSETILVYPFHKVRDRVDKIIDRKNTLGWIGVSGEDWPGKVGGVHIVHVTPNGPAEKAGLQMSDIILSVGGKEITHANELAHTIAHSSPGEKIKLAVLRHSGIHSVTVCVGSESDKSTINATFKLPDLPVYRNQFTPSSYQSRDKKITSPNKEFIMLRLNNLEKEIQELKQLLKNNH